MGVVTVVPSRGPTCCPLERCTQVHATDASGVNTMNTSSKPQPAVTRPCRSESQSIPESATRRRRPFTKSVQSNACRHSFSVGRYAMTTLVTPKRQMGRLHSMAHNDDTPTR